MSDPTTRTAGEARSLGAALHRLHDKWGAIVAFGVLLIALGFAATVFALAATVASVLVNGVVFLIAGAAEIGIGMHSQGWSRFFLWVIGGLLYLIAGLICIFNPLLASAVLTLMLGAGLIAAGVVRLFLGFQLPSDHPRAMVFLASAVTILLGLIIVGHWPADSVFVLGTLLGVDLIFHGAGWVSFGLGLRARR
ncbi:MAG TPA: HdeD family acid-resistance protein [Roseiarcus sp.]|nr:HdeD family acid-resistance protein [Roseiarcus sp.]